MTIFTHTKVDQCVENENGYELITEAGLTIQCKYVVIAAGFESGKFLPKQVMQLTSTYALVSQPLQPEQLWLDRALIWETKEPYLYIRTTNDNRIIVGGEDEDFKNPIKRDALLRKKISILEKKNQKTLSYHTFCYGYGLVWYVQFNGRWFTLYWQLARQ